MLNTEIYELLNEKCESGDFAAFADSFTAIRRECTSLQLSSALGKILENRVARCREILKKSGTASEEENACATMTVKMLAYQLQMLCETRSATQTRTCALLLLELLSYKAGDRYDLMTTAIKCASYAMTNPGYSWSNIKAMSPDMIAYRISSGARFDRQQVLGALRTDSRGLVEVGSGRMTVSSAKGSDGRVVSISSRDGMLEVCTRNERDEILKSSEREKVECIEMFASTFRKQQRSRTPVPHASSKKRLAQGESYTIHFETGGGEGGEVFCLPVDIGKGERVPLLDEEYTKGFWTKHIKEHLYDNDYVKGAVYMNCGSAAAFSIKDAFVDFAAREARSDRGCGRIFQARVVDIYKGASEDKDRYIVMSDKGYGGLMRINGGHKVGEIIPAAYVHSVIERGDDVFINMDEIENYSRESAEFDEDKLLTGFCLNEEDAVESPSESREKRDAGPDRELIRQLGTILSRSAEGSAISRYKDKLAASFILDAVNDSEETEWAMARAEFLNQCLRAAERLQVYRRQDSFSLNEHETVVIKALEHLGRPQDLKEIVMLLDECRTEDERRLIRLLTANSLLLTDSDEITLNTEEQMKKICRQLKVEEHFKSRQQRGGGKYGNGELDNIEFKSSYVFSNRDGKADLFRQGRGQVLEAVCGFMNSSGGTVYLGVNDSGDPLDSDSYGINADLTWFSQNYNSVNKARFGMLGHSVPNPKDLDSYCLFLASELDLYFKPSVRKYVSITPTEDGDAIRYVVKPSEFEIAKLYTDNSFSDGEVYVRNGVSTLPMSRVEQERRLMKLRSVGKVEQYILTLGEAIEKKHKVLLKDYASSNSNQVRDRLVVPINLICGDENLWAYDLDAKACREFRLSRIGSIDTDVKNPKYTHSFPPGVPDVFRWVNPQLNYRIRLRMDIGALNCLMEEYPDAKSLPEEELYQEEDGKWILDTVLHGIEAVRRFYLGLADKIEILDSEDSQKLRDSIAAFLHDNFR